MGCGSSMTFFILDSGSFSLCCHVKLNGVHRGTKAIQVFIGEMIETVIILPLETYIACDGMGVQLDSEDHSTCSHTIELLIIFESPPFAVQCIFSLECIWIILLHDLLCLLFGNTFNVFEMSRVFTHSFCFYKSKFSHTDAMKTGRKTTINKCCDKYLAF